MNLSEIREECWAIARDTAITDSDRLWPTDEMNRYINRVYQQIARETLCLRDSTTVDICLMNSDPVDWTTYEEGTLDYIWANDPNSWLYHKDVCPYLYPLHDSIIKIHEVKWSYRQWKLTPVSVTKWQHNVWWEQVIGMPTEYALDLETGKLAVNFRSQSSDILRMLVSRMPTTLLSNDADIPEFRTAYHTSFYNGVLALMYSKEDADTINEKKAAEHRELFKDDIDEIKQSEHIIHQRLRPNYPLGGTL